MQEPVRSRRLPKVLLGIAVSSMALTLHGCMEYAVNITYTCKEFKEPSGICTEWQALGGVQQPMCVPGDDMVITPGGPKPMSEVQLGDFLLGVDRATGKQKYSAVRAWLHRDSTAEVEMVAARSEAGTFVASAKHLVGTGAASEGRYAFIDQLQAGDELIAANGSAIHVQGIDRVRKQGLYAPLTFNSNFFAGKGQPHDSVLVHSFAHLPEPQWLEAPTHFAMSVLELLNPFVHDLKGEEAYVHPLARWCLWALGSAPFKGFAVDQEITSGAVSHAQARRLGGKNNDNSKEIALIMSIFASMPPFLQGGR